MCISVCSKFDEDTHLAIALSIHDEETANHLRGSEKQDGDDNCDAQLLNKKGNKPDLYTILMTSKVSKNLDQPAVKKCKKKLQYVCHLKNLPLTIFFVDYQFISLFNALLLVLVVIDLVAAYLFELF